MGALLNKLTSIFQNPPEAPIVETKINRRALAHAREVLKIDDTKYFNIAVAGKQNAGKSTFINALCGRANFERGDDIAEACPLETTRKPKAFYASRFPHLRLYDLPGFGTLDIHSDNYLDKYIFNEGVCAMYCILLFYESGIPQEFARFVKEAKKYNVNLAIIHSKADQVLKNYHKNDNPTMFPTIDQEAANRVVKLLLEVFEKKKQQPEYKLFRNIPCFVISSRKLLAEFGKKQYNGGADIEEYLEYQEQDFLQFISKLKDIEKIENDIRKEVLTYMHISCIQQAKFISRKWMQTVQNNNNELPRVCLKSLIFRKAPKNTKFESEICGDPAKKSVFAQFFSHIANTLSTDKLDAVDVSFNEERKNLFNFINRTYKREDFIKVFNDCYMDLSVDVLSTPIDQDYVVLLKSIKELYIRPSRVINIKHWNMVCFTDDKFGLQKSLKECGTYINSTSIDIFASDKHVDARQYLEMFVENFDFSFFANLNMLNHVSFLFDCYRRWDNQEEKFTLNIITFIRSIIRLQQATFIRFIFPFSDKKYVNLIIKEYIKVYSDPKIVRKVENKLTFKCGANLYNYTNNGCLPEIDQLLTSSGLRKLDTDHTVALDTRKFRLNSPALKLYHARDLTVEYHLDDSYNIDCLFVLEINHLNV